MTIDPFAPDALEDPYPLYERMRTEAPVYRLPENGMYMVSRHADVVEAAGKPETFSSHISAIVYRGDGLNTSVIEADPEAIGAVDVLATQDPPKHTAQRKLMNRMFVHDRIRELEAPIVAFADGAIDGMLARGGGDWMAEVANPLPVTIITGVLGMPVEDSDDLVRWADAGVDLLSGTASQERIGEAFGEMAGFLEYLRARMASPEPGTATAEVADAVARGDLDEREGVSLLLQLVIAGSESTTSLLGSAVRLLAEDQALQERLRAEPAGIGAFLEEVLRMESPFRGHFRVATQDTTLGGVEIPKGARVMLLWGAANRDDEAFADAGALDTARDNLKRHLAFGTGIHFCIGAPLARLEGRLTIERLLERTTSVVASGPATHVPSLFVRRLEALPVALG